MAQIGSLVVDLIAQTASFNANIQRAARELNSNANRMNRSLDSIERKARAVGTGVRSMVGFLAGAGLVSVASDALDYAAGLGELSTQLGVTTDDLQIYSFAATQVGIEQEAMQKGLAKLTKVIGDAANGSKEAGKIFDALGIDVHTASGEVKTAGEIMPELADAISQIESPAERASVLVKLLGKNGQQMATLLEGGAAGVMDFTRAAEELGIVLSSEQIARADEAADKLAAVKKVVEVNIAQAVADNADSLVKLANAIGAVGRAASRISPAQWKLILAGAATGAVAGFLSPVPGGTLIGAAGGAALVGFAADAGNRAGAASRVNRLPFRPGESGESAMRFDAKTGKFVSARPRATTATGDVDPDAIFEKTSDGADKAKAKVDEFARTMASLRERSATAAIELQALNENWPDSELDAALSRQQLYNDIAALGPDISQRQAAELRRVADALVEAERATTLAAMSQEIHNDALEEARERTNDFRAEVEALGDALFEVPELNVDIPDESFADYDRTVEMAQDIGYAFGEAARTAVDSFGDIEKAGEQLVHDLARIFTQRFIIEPIVNAATGWASKLLNVAASSFSFGGTGGGSGGLGSIALPSGAPGFDSGGWTGDVARHAIAGVVHGQEFVVHAQAARANLPLLEAINDNRPLPVPGYFLGGLVGGKLGAFGFAADMLGLDLPSVTPLGLIGDALGDDIGKTAKKLSPALMLGDALGLNAGDLKYLSPAATALGAGGLKSLSPAAMAAGAFGGGSSARAPSADAAFAGYAGAMRNVERAGGINFYGNINVPGAMNDDDARRTGRQIAAGMMAQSADARRKGIAG